MEMRQLTKIILAYELLKESVSKSQIAMGVSRRTIIRWSQAIEDLGSFEAFLKQHHQAKKGPRQKRKTDAILKRRVWALREKHYQCCGQKIQYFLRKEYGMQVNVTTIYKILSEKYQLRSKWHTCPPVSSTGRGGGQCQGKNKPRGPLPVAQAARQVLQMDTVLFGEVFSFHSSRYLH